MQTLSECDFSVAPTITRKRGLDPSSNIRPVSLGAALGAARRGMHFVACEFQSGGAARSSSSKRLVAPTYRASGMIGVLPVRVLVLLSLSVLIPRGTAQTCPANIPHIQGVWRTLPYLMPINPISATLLHTGQVLIVAGSENDANNNSTGAESYRNAIWDPTGTTQSSITVQQINYDVFCSGTAALPDGRPLVIGG